MELTPIELYKILGTIGYVICLWQTSLVFRPGNPMNNVWNKGACVLLVGTLPLAALLNAVGIDIWSGPQLVFFISIFAVYVLKPFLAVIFLMTGGTKSLTAQ
jgi:hypothetical protein